jgi:hypothetical protein
MEARRRPTESAAADDRQECLHVRELHEPSA